MECKTVKESGYNKFSSVSRQLKAYVDLAKHNDFRVVKFLLVAPDLSDEFVKDRGLEYELNLSLITAGSLKKIAEGFMGTKHKSFPHNLLLRDVLIHEDRVLKVLSNGVAVLRRKHVFREVEGLSGEGGLPSGA